MVQSIDSILIPTDGSEGAMLGARRGVDLAGTVGADIHTLSVIDTREIEPALTSLDSNELTAQEKLAEEQAKRAVEDVAGMAQSALSALVRTAVQRGIPFQSITEYATAHDIDLIVMGTHGRTGLERVLLGSVAEKTLRTASVPVLMIPSNSDPIEVGTGEYQDILLPTDGSDGAEAAIDWGVTLAEIYDATTHTVYAVDRSVFSATDEVADTYDALEQTGEDALETVREWAKKSGVPVRGNIGSGPATDVILSYVDEHEIDIIVMGTHGRSGVERYLIGSVTEEVVRNADVPVCCVPIEELS